MENIVAAFQEVDYAGSGFVRTDLLELVWQRLTQDVHNGEDVLQYLQQLTQTLEQDGVVSYFEIISMLFSMVDILVLTGGCEGCTIPKTEERSITLCQLQRLASYIEAFCEKQRWTSTDGRRNGELLIPRTVNLYDCVVWLIKPATHRRRCSYVELVATERQPPTWFVSHWWGEPVLGFVACIKQHSADRDLGDDCGYWVCAYANNQWQLGGDLSDDPAVSSFRRAMSVARGTVSVVDANAVCFTRIWCSYEIFVSLTPVAAGLDGQRYLYDVYTSDHSCAAAVGFTDGPAAIDLEQGKSEQWLHRGGAYSHKAHRERDFPLELAARSLSVRLEEAEASCEADRMHILNAIAERPLYMAPEKHHPSYEKVNAALRWRLAMAMYETAEEHGRVSEFGLNTALEPQGWESLALDMNTRLSFAWQRRGRFRPALEFAQRAMSIMHRKFADDEVCLAAVFHQTATIHYDLAQYDPAFELFEKAMALRSRVLGEEHPDFGESCNAMAILHRKRGGFARATELFETALRIKCSAHGENHPDVGKTCNDMAKIFEKQGDYSRALELYGRALAIRQRLLGGDDPDLGKTYNDMALVHERQGCYAKALELFEMALNIRRKALGEDHPSVGSTLNNMAKVHVFVANYGQGLELYQKALKIRSQALGEDHPNVASTYHNMARVYSKLAEYRTAVGLYEKALRIRLASLGQEHPEVASTYSELAHAHGQAGDSGRALDLLGRALAINLHTLGEEHPAVASTLHSLAGVHRGRGEHAAAWEHYERALRIREKALGSDHPEVGDTYNDMAFVREEQGDYAHALQLYERAARIRLACLGEAHPDLGRTYAAMAAILEMRGELDQAEDLRGRTAKIRHTSSAEVLKAKSTEHLDRP